ncbi:segregation and condensation protein B [Candidatus Omnitrophus magneticus]|uniref:Segregation and condensation protein B n=1 Tax=Candidatus Omnitrophus magneticus TaxID=1609969 RepID=A0A0F0CML6_9BACT|nr:segregation and condensation protein B [Candidatus Omnitrophus magneticus]
MEKIEKIKRIIEALIIASEAGLKREDLYELLKEEYSGNEIDEALTFLREEYNLSEHSFTITEVAGRVCVATKPDYVSWINKLYNIEPSRLSGQSLETLAIIAYRQPATRAEIEEIRGVNSGGVLKALMEKELIHIKGRKDVPGRPLMYGTTEKFMQHFGLNSLDDLPSLKEFTEEDLDFKNSLIVQKDDETIDEKDALEISSASEEKKEDENKVEETVVSGIDGGISNE